QTGFSAPDGLALARPPAASCNGPGWNSSGPSGAAYVSSGESPQLHLPTSNAPWLQSAPVVYGTGHALRPRYETADPSPSDALSALRCVAPSVTPLLLKWWK